MEALRREFMVLNETQLNGVRRDSQRLQSRQVLPQAPGTCHACGFAGRAPQRQLSSLLICVRSSLAISYYAALVLRAAWPPWLRCGTVVVAAVASSPRRTVLRLARSAATGWPSSASYVQAWRHQPVGGTRRVRRR